MVRRQLQQGAIDSRYAQGETILTTWPPPPDFAGINVFTTQLHVDENGDARSDRTETLPSPVFHAAGLLASMGERHWVIHEQQVGGHVVAGFASSGADGSLRLVVYNHHAHDTQSRSEASFELALVLRGLKYSAVQVQQYRFDRARHSCFEQARTLLDRQTDRATAPGAIEAARAALESEDPAEQRKVLDLLPGIARADLLSLAGPFLALVERTPDDALRRDLQAAVARLGTRAYPAEDVKRLCQQVELQPLTDHVVVDEDGTVRLEVPLTANGTMFLILAPGERR
jgi:hypothetical protein